jgi:hypothetical protein
LRGLSRRRAYAAGASDAQFEVRALIGQGSGYEDLVIGSSTPAWRSGRSARAWLRAVRGRKAPCSSARRVHARQPDGDIRIGGDVCAVVAGTVVL